MLMNRFLKQKKSLSNFDILSQIMPPLSCYFYNSNYSDEDNKKTTNNIIEVINGKYKRGQMNKGVLDSMSNGFIQSIFNDFGYNSCSNFIDDLQNIVTEYMKISSYSVGISDLIANRTTNDKIIEAITSKKRKVMDIIEQTHLGVFENNTGRSNEVEFENTGKFCIEQSTRRGG